MNYEVEEKFRLKSFYRFFNWMTNNSWAQVHSGLIRIISSGTGECRHYVGMVQKSLITLLKRSVLALDAVYQACRISMSYMWVIKWKVNITIAECGTAPVCTCRASIIVTVVMFLSELNTWLHGSIGGTVHTVAGATSQLRCSGRYRQWLTHL